MNSRPYGELEEQLKALRAEAETKKAKEAADLAPSSQRYDGLREEHGLQKGREKTSAQSQSQLKEITHGLPGREQAPAEPMRVNTEKDRSEVRQAQAGERAMPQPRMDMQPTPGGTNFQARRPSLWDRPAEPGSSRQEQARQATGTKQPNVFDQPVNGEMTERMRAAQSREVNKEMSANRQRNPFSREASEAAQRLLQTIAGRSQGDRGR